MNEIATALPIRDGMNHIVISKLFSLKKVQFTTLIGKLGLEFTRLLEMRR